MENKHNRVMFVTNSLSGGGAERATNVLVNALSDLEVEVSLIAVNKGSEDLVAPRCAVFELHREWKGGLFSVLKAYFEVQKIVWRWRPDYLVLNCDMPELLGSVTIGKHKLIAVEHASQPWPQRRSLGKVVRKLLRYRRTKWVAVSDHLKVWGLDVLPDFVINNPIESLLPLINSHGNQNINEIRRLVFVGRLSPEKNPTLLVSAAKEANLPIKFVGSGEHAELVRDMCKASSITAEFTGFVKDPWAEIQPGDLLIVPSNNEGDGLVIVEAIQRGVPLMIRDIPDLTRFGLLDTNYFKNHVEIGAAVKSNRYHLNNFVVSKEIADLVLSKRNPELVAKKWLEVFSK
jgi:GalNAc-alpha-(1->4)-GalNAc-alpha-(1->3)-diNAcBac-PP-undecaprenol alpha-1,4-N-acetyl-D-galactosaminyltransferase